MSSDGSKSWQPTAEFRGMILQGTSGPPLRTRPGHQSPGARWCRLRGPSPQTRASPLRVASCSEEVEAPASTSSLGPGVYLRAGRMPLGRARSAGLSQPFWAQSLMTVEDRPPVPPKVVWSTTVFLLAVVRKTTEFLPVFHPVVVLSTN